VTRNGPCPWCSTFSVPGETIRTVRRMAMLGIASTAVLLMAGCGGSQQAVRHAPTTTRSPSPTITSASVTTSPSSVSTTESTSSPPVPPLPTLTIASWTGREPVALYFSGDAGDIATGISWTVWDQTEAVGHGVRKELSCVPNCAQGTATPYPVTLTLAMPVDGAFTSIQEQTADGKGTTEKFSPHDVQGVCSNSNQDSCVFVGP
jgi:hypothetical protein